MTPLEEAYLAIFGVRPAEGMTEEELALLVIEGLSVELHGRDLVGRCLEYICGHGDRFSGLVMWWTDRDLKVASSI